MNENKPIPICKTCAEKAKAKGYLVHYLPPYLLQKRQVIRCYLCKKKRYHAMYLNHEFKKRPRKVRTVR